MKERRKTICFVGSIDIERQLKQWATEDDRSISAVIRKAIEAEAERRDRQETKEVVPA